MASKGKERRRLARAEAAAPLSAKKVKRRGQRPRAREGGEKLSGHGGTLKEGDRVEARFGGHEDWFKGRITKVWHVTSGETFDISYDDGDSEERVDRKLVRVALCCVCNTPHSAAKPTVRCKGDGCEVELHPACYKPARVALEGHNWFCEACLARFPAEGELQQLYLGLREEGGP